MVSVVLDKVPGYSSCVMVTQYSSLGRAKCGQLTYMYTTFQMSIHRPPPPEHLQPSEPDIDALEETAAYPFKNSGSVFMPDATNLVSTASLLPPLTRSCSLQLNVVRDDAVTNLEVPMYVAASFYREKVQQSVNLLELSERPKRMQNG